MNNSITLNTLSERSENIHFDRNVLEGASILLVEDNKINQDVAKAMLHQRGMLVDIAENGEQAVEMVRGNEFDCVLMDIQMPVMDGHTATRIIREELQFVNLPILALTAKVLEIDIKKSLASGMNCHIPKPINLELLLNEMAYWISHSQGQQDTIMRDCLDKVGGNNDLFIQILHVFLKKHTTDYDAVIELLEDGDTSGARKLIHALKGVAPVVGAEKLYTVAVELEASLLNETANELTPLLERLDTNLQETVRAVQEYIDSNKQ